MDLGLIVMAGMYVFPMVVGCVFVVRRWSWKRRKRLGRKRLGFYPEIVVLGNALQQLQVMADPQVRYVIAEKLEEEAEDDDAGGPDDPTAHLLRQARRIRRGEEIGRLTVIRR